MHLLAKFLFYEFQKTAHGESAGDLKQASIK
jgi:hypothetical protein